MAENGKDAIKQLKQEVDVYIANFLRQEVVEKEKKTQLEAQVKVIKDLELQITKWHAEEHRQQKTIQILTAQREIKAREASKAQALERETQEELKVKKLEQLVRLKDSKIQALTGKLNGM